MTQAINSIKRIMLAFFEHYVPVFKMSQLRQADAQEEIAKQLKRIADMQENLYLENKTPKQ